MSRWAAVWVVIPFLLIGCEDNQASTDQGGVRDIGVGPGTGDGPKVSDAVSPGAQTYSLLLSGNQMAPRVQSSGSGTATLTVSADKSQIQVSVIVSNLGGLTGAEIQLGEVGAPGPAIFVLSTQAFTNPLQVTLRAADFRAQPSRGVTSFTEAISTIGNGGAYLVVKTANAPNGELRGQIGQINLDGDLSADQVQPPATSTATGTVKVVVAGDQQSLSVTVTPKNVVNSTGAFIYAGSPGQNGPVIFKVTTQPLGDSASATLKSEDLTPQPSQGINTFANAIDAVLAGQTYVVINTQVNPNGEVRGHIGRMNFNANLTGAQMVPPVDTTANAAAQVIVPNSRKHIDVYVNAFGVTNMTGSSMYVGAVGVNGPPIFVVAPASFESPYAKALVPTDLQLQSGNGITSFSDAIHAMMKGLAYLVITTVDHPSGFLRGQIGQ